MVAGGGRLRKSLSKWPHLVLAFPPSVTAFGSELRRSPKVKRLRHPGWDLILFYLI